MFAKPPTGQVLLPIDPALITEVGNTPLARLMDVIAGPFYVIDQDGRPLLWNHHVEHATQRDTDELRGMNVLDLFDAADRQQVADKIQQVFAQRDSVQLEAQLVSKDGRRPPYLFSGARFQCGDHHFLCGMGIDLTSRRRHQEASLLRERAVHAASNGIIISRCVGDDNPVEYVNPAFERITGYSGEEVIGRDARFMSVPGLDEAERCRVHEAIRARREVHALMRNQRKNGDIFWNELKITPVQDDQGHVTHFIGVINDVTTLKQRADHLEHEVNHDPLTGLANRTLLRDRLDQALHAAQRSKSLVAVALLDLNNFKQINDTLGHGVGDEVLKTVARRLMSAVRDSDTVARLSGDEFVLVLASQPSLRYTLRMVERIRGALQQPMECEGKEIAASASIGVSVFPHDGTAGFELLRAADVAMYQSKAERRGEVHFFSADMHSTTEARHKLELHMRDALEHDEIFLMFQPRIALATHAITGVEALLRWRHPERGVLAPAEFIGDAEENGLIVPFGHSVLDHVCRAAQRLHQLGYGDLPISMNACYREFSQKGYIARIGAALARLGLPPDCFELELKEEHLLRNAQLSDEVIEDIRQLGIRLAVDDFGAGASNLSYLKDLPVSRFKMSRSAVSEICPAGAAGMMARTIISIGHNMNRRIIAAGVESQAQYDFLRQHDCDELQGYWFSKPLTQEGLEQLLAARGAAVQGASLIAENQMQRPGSDPRV
ncbi:MAG: EAL domain-containing protein [Pseudomonadota bacterium]